MPKRALWPPRDVSHQTAEYCSRRDPPSGGPQQSAEKPATGDTDSRVLHPAGLPLYPWGVGLYKPPGAPMQRVELLIHHMHLERGVELDLPFFLL